MVFLFLAPDNITCIPSIGIFLYSEEHLNFTDALEMCKTMGGSLAHVLSDRRTNALSLIIHEKSSHVFNSNLINGSPTVAPPNGTTVLPPLRLRHAWVGLHEEKLIGEFFTTTEEEPIECFLYRAWHPGHPKYAYLIAIYEFHQLNFNLLDSCSVFLVN